MKSNYLILAEGVFVGILLIVFTLISQMVLIGLGYPRVDLPNICANWNDTHIMEANLFLAGFLFHVIFEYTGLNKNYVDNYYK